MKERPVVHLTRKSWNPKTGPMAVSATEPDSCPPSCPLLGGGCYAKHGGLSWHWKRVGGDRGDSWGTFITNVRALPHGAMFRHNQAGDLPGDGEKLAAPSCMELSSACEGKKAFTYTHYQPTEHNVRIIRAMRGITVNLSADNHYEADQFMETGLPVTVTLPEDAAATHKTANGNLVVVCPEQTGKVENCMECMLCAKRSRDYIIGFRAHGAGAKYISA